LLRGEPGDAPLRVERRDLAAERAPDVAPERGAHEEAIVEPDRLVEVHPEGRAVVARLAHRPVRGGGGVEVDPADREVVGRAADILPLGTGVLRADGGTEDD